MKVESLVGHKAESKSGIFTELYVDSKISFKNSILNVLNLVTSLSLSLRLQEIYASKKQNFQLLQIPAELLLCFTFRMNSR